LVLEGLLYFSVEAFVKGISVFLVLLFISSVLGVFFSKTIVVLLLERAPKLLIFRRIYLSLFFVKHVSTRLLVLEHEVEVLLLLLLKFLLLHSLLLVKIRARPLLLFVTILISSRRVFLPVAQALRSLLNLNLHLAGSFLICNKNSFPFNSTFKSVHLSMGLNWCRTF